MSEDVRDLLEGIKEGSVSVDEALLKLKMKPFEDVGYAKVDMHRKLRQGVAEVIYGAGKTPQQIIGIADVMIKNGQQTILITRLSKESADVVKEAHPLEYFPEARCGIIGEIPKADGLGKVVIATGGTSDVPVAEEAAVTAMVLGNEVVRLYDVGVAGLHRTLAHLEDI
ncbi:MAG: 1-(5-phosphoribosyl)-5-amino-4-imidazole-carboxylate carboxylase, partial [Lachnospiraceae bacterium]|nr:1-(5-phosphoribosyl)-5-amino-4-imidazole-carboxylate carboxylase [Lachnospiraceae bacterium]